MIKNTDLRVEMKAVFVHYECPFCENENKISYSDFCEEVGEPCDWRYINLECKKCNKSFEVNDVEWD